MSPSDVSTFLTLISLWDQVKSTTSLFLCIFTILFSWLGGVYLALDDFWIEYVSGGFNVEIAPNNKQTPYIAIRLHGSTGQEALGVMARLQLEGFKLAGDKGRFCLSCGCITDSTRRT